MRIFSIIILSMVMQLGFSQDGAELFTAIGNSDTKTLSAKFINDMEICIGSEQDYYTKAEAVARLDKFFNEVSPKSCSFLHKGSSKDKTSKYSVGVMDSSKGKYRVFIYFEGDKVSSVMFNPE